MPRAHVAVFLLLLAALACRPAAESPAEPPAPGTREARILANLELALPRLAELDVALGEIEPTDYPGLESGSYTVTGPRGNTRTQRFLVSADDTELYLLAREPIDVSRSTAEIADELAERAAEAARKAAERAPRLVAAAEGRPARGNPEAELLVVEFSDFQCPFCARGAETVDELLERRGEQARFVYLHLPLAIHPWARPAAIAAECAARQDPEAFWRLHDAFFAEQKEITVANVLARSRDALAGSGIDLEAFAACAGDESSAAHRAAAARVEADMALAKELEVSGTPVFFVQGERLQGARPLEAFEAALDGAKQAR